MTESEISDIRTRFEKLQENLKKFAKLPEAQHQAWLFTSWIGLCSIGTPLKAPKPNMFWCPKCKKWEELRFPCGLTIGEAINLLREEIPLHAQKVKKARQNMV